MLGYKPVLATRHRLGQIESLTSGLTSNFAKQIVTEAEPVIRRIIKQERNKYAQALIGAIPFGVISALAYVGTKYMIPDQMALAKTVGYVTSAIAAAGGAWWTVSNLTEDIRPEQPSKGGPTAADPYIQQASQAIVTAAEPKVRALVDDERRKLADAGLMALPFAIASLGAFLSTMFLVDPENKGTKAIGYTGSALLLGAGAWFGLQKELEAA
jgi:hypothetical protein